MTIYSGFSHWTWGFSIVMLVYQRVYIYVCVSIRLYSFIFSSDVHQPWYFPNKNPGISGLVSMANPHWKLYKNLPELRIFLRETPGNHHSKIIWGWFSMGFSMVFPWFSMVFPWLLHDVLFILGKSRPFSRNPQLQMLLPLALRPGRTNVLDRTWGFLISDSWTFKMQPLNKHLLL